jgi:pyridoxal phosphate enzyme (YggS family)
MNIEQNITTLKNSIPQHVELIAVSKTKPISDILQAYNTGHKAFGENKIQEMVGKFEQMPKDIEWHMIGHLQRNKVKYMAHFVHLIHGVDSLKTLIEINKQAKKYSRIINCLLQVKIASEDTKFGLEPSEVEKIINSNEFNKLHNIKVCGFMGMGSFTSEEAIIRKEFKVLKNIFDIHKVKETHNFSPTILSMGMSGDYKIAIEEGSTMIRVGSSIFGVRSYT